MTLPRIMAILEEQRVDMSVHPSGQCAQARILGIATTAEKIMEAVGGGWNEAIELAAKLFEPGCSCPEPCEDYLIWPSPCATKAAAQIRSLRRPDAVPVREGVSDRSDLVHEMRSLADTIMRIDGNRDPARTSQLICDTTQTLARCLRKTADLLSRDEGK